MERFTIQKSDVSALTAIFHVVEHFSTHTGQIIMLTKMFAAIDLEFYDFKDGVPIHAWKSASSSE
jgi:uncharacterized damage-inducible protein DinB